MAKMFISDTDGITNKVDFEFNPWCDIYPNFDITMYSFKSVPGWDSATGAKTPPIITNTNFGGSEEGGIINLWHEYMSFTKYNEFLAKYKAGAEQLFRRYFKDGSYSDYTVYISKFSKDIIQGTEFSSWKMELTIIEVL